MRTYRLVREQSMPITLDEAWDFFSSPDNLEKITPVKMSFKVTSPPPVGPKMYEGMIITYTIKPLFGIKMNWMTEITHIRDKEYFVDEQRFGPYAMWHHEHHFKEIPGGVHMTDILNYAIPYGPIGRLANAVLVRREVENTFSYREKVIREKWGSSFES